MYDHKIIKEELKSLQPEDFYMKYIVKSYNWYFEEVLSYKEQNVMDALDQFKEIVSQNFKVSFHSVQMVGSAKIGFSLSPNKNLRRFVRKTNDKKDKDKKESDIDLAVVSNVIFKEVWDALRERKTTYYSSNYDRIARSIFQGYINDKDFRDITESNFKLNEMITNSNMDLVDELSIQHQISYRIYRSWEDLELYQLRSIEKARMI